MTCDRCGADRELHGRVLNGEAVALCDSCRRVVDQRQHRRTASGWRRRSRKGSRP